MTIGTYRAHFTGYQPRARASQEFCEDIPTVSNSIIVLDFISRALREMSVDFRIVYDVKEIGISATEADLGTDADIEAATMFYLPAKAYPRGSLDASITFESAGNYIGILTATDGSGADARRYVSVFPFSVGLSNWWARLKWVGVALILGVALLVWSLRSNKVNRAAT